MLSAIDDVAVNTGRTRNEILVLSMEYALDNLEIVHSAGKRERRGCQEGSCLD